MADTARDVFDTYLINTDDDGAERTIATEYSEEQLSALFHENSKNPQLHITTAVPETVLDFAKTVPRRNLEQPVELPQPVDEPGLTDVLAKRSSVRQYNPYDIPVQELSQLLRYACGCRPGSEHRTYPSAGALYPVETYWLNRSDNGLDLGPYRYEPTEHVLDRVVGGTSQDLFGAGVTDAVDVDDLAGFVVLTGVFQRSRIKYGERGYRYTLLEAGHIAQNVSLVAGDIGLATVPLGGFYDRRVESALGIDGVNESVLYMIGVGKLDGN